MSEQLARLEAGEKAIRDIFGGKYAFSIPPYQRPYAWEVSHVTTLVDDLLYAMDNVTTESGSDLYFLGSIVLVKKPNEIDARVVDGQQRLTTLTILFSVLRDLTTDNTARLSREKYVKQPHDPDTGARERLRFEMRSKDQKFFATNVQTLGATETLPEPDLLESSQRRIVENAQAMRAMLADVSEDRRNNLIRYILTNCFLVVVEVPTDRAARRIFTVLNARGLDLSAQDILKADLLERAGTEYEETLSSEWEELEAMLEPRLFADLFTHIRMIFQREKPRNSLEEGFPQFVKPFTVSPRTFVSNVLQPYAEALEKAERHQQWIGDKFGDETLSLLKSLNRLDNKDWVSPFIYALKRAKDDASFDFPKCVFQLERLAYYHFATRADVNARIRRYADVLNQLDHEFTGQLKSGGLALSQSEAMTLFDNLDKPIYLNRRLPKPLLLRLDQALSDGSASYNYPVISVEHVFPQTPNADSKWREQFDEDRAIYWLHRIGNLVLLPKRKNSAASNYEFGKKKETYFKQGDSSPFELTQQVLQEEEWTPEIVQRRQEASLKAYANDWDLSDEFKSWSEMKDLI